MGDIFISGLIKLLESMICHFAGVFCVQEAYRKIDKLKRSTIQRLEFRR